MRFAIALAGAFCLAAAPLCCCLPGSVPLLTGELLDTWEISPNSFHGNTEGWVLAEDGVLEGMQDIPGNGGLLLTQKEYGDFILDAEINPDWGMDSGIYLRSTERGHAYQITVDYRENGRIGSVFGERIGGFLYIEDEWEQCYKAGKWNRLRIKCVGNPPVIDVWMNGHHLVHWADEEEPRLGDTGRIALQIHAGEQYYGVKTRFRNLCIVELDAETEQL
jgi:hypothetical protein